MTETTLPANGLDLVRNRTREDLEQLQLQRLRQTLEGVYAKVPAYRAKFEAACVRPEDLESLGDLASFPFTTKQDLRDNYPFGLFAVTRDQLLRVHASSGTTGKSTVVGYTPSDLENWTDLVARSLHVAGVRSGDTLQVAFGYGLFTGGLGAHYGAERLGCAVIPVSVGQTARQVQLIRDLEPDVIMATPSYVLTIADEFERQGIDPRDSSLRIGIFGAEPWSEPMRKEIEGRFGIEALDLYGLSEVIGPGVSQEFAESKGAPTVWEDHFYPEVIDPESGAVLPEGEEGELVLTTLTKEAHPPAPAGRRLHAADGAGRGAQRRHADHPRRQCLPHPDRGAGARPAAPVSALPARSLPGGPPGPAGRPGGDESGSRERERIRQTEHRRGVAARRQVLRRSRRPRPDRG